MKLKEQFKLKLISQKSSMGHEKKKTFVLDLMKKSNRCQKINREINLQIHTLEYIENAEIFYHHFSVKIS